METAVSQQQNAVARFLFGLYFAVCNMTVKEEQTMKKMILMTANGMNLFETWRCWSRREITARLASA